MRIEVTQIYNGCKENLVSKCHTVKKTIPGLFRSLKIQRSTSEDKTRLAKTRNVDIMSISLEFLSNVLVSDSFI